MDYSNLTLIELKRRVVLVRNGLEYDKNHGPRKKPGRYMVEGEETTRKNWAAYWKGVLKTLRTVIKSREKQIGMTSCGEKDA